MLRFLPHSTQIRFISSNEIDFKIENARNMVHFKRKYTFIKKDKTLKTKITLYLIKSTKASSFGEENY